MIIQLIKYNEQIPSIISKRNNRKTIYFEAVMNELINPQKLLVGHFS